ncbi:MAG: hypothetical protein K2J70_08460 [Muribaculaceae bacterium]|nr:hypothetical protein [Muribaculaceae bacterium]
MHTKFIRSVLPAALFLTLLPARAHTVERPVKASVSIEEFDSLSSDVDKIKKHLSLRDRVHLGGYGEVIFNYDFSSKRTGISELGDGGIGLGKALEDAPRHGSLNVPRAVIMLGVYLGKGWGMETDVQIENCTSVSLDQFWIEKQFRPEACLRAGYLTLPVGATNAHDDPLEFFAVNRPEAEDGILPCDWHQSGLSFFGEAGVWSYEGIVIPGLATSLFNGDRWLIPEDESGLFDYSAGNEIAFAGRVDNRSAEGLRLSVSGYWGASLNNRLIHPDGKRERVRGTVGFLSFDFCYEDYGWALRGNGNWGRYSKVLDRDGAHYRSGAESAFSAAFEGGYDLLRFKPSTDQRLYLFGRYDYWEPADPDDSFLGYGWGERQRVAAGLNYFPIDRVVVKAQYSHTFTAGGGGIPMVSVGIAYSGQFF